MTERDQTERGCLPILRTESLMLRGLDLADAPALQEICLDIEIARPTCSIPHPYPEGRAEQFIRDVAVQINNETNYVFAIVRQEDGALIGDIGLDVNKSDNNAELGFLIGKKYWSNGYATEAIAAVLRWGLEERGLHRVFGHCMGWNEASAKAMLKAGMKEEGTLRGHFLKWGKYEDARTFGMLLSDLNETERTHQK